MLEQWRRGAALALLLLAFLGGSLTVSAYDWVKEVTDGPHSGDCSWSKAWVKAYMNIIQGNPQWYEVVSSEHNHWYYSSATESEPQTSSYGGGVNTAAWSQTKVLVKYCKLQEVAACTYSYTIGLVIFCYWQPDSYAKAISPY